MGLLEHKGGWDCTGWGNVHSNSHLSLFKPSPLFIAGICFFSVGFQIWIYMMFFNAERSERIWILLLGFLFTESSCSQIFMSRITNVHAMLAQRVTGRAVRPAEHTARQMRDAKEDNTWPSIINFSYVDTMLLSWLDAEEWERGTGRLSFTMLTGVNWGIIFHWRIFTRIPLIQREQPSWIVCRLAGAAEL